MDPRDERLDEDFRRRRDDISNANDPLVDEEVVVDRPAAYDDTTTDRKVVRDRGEAGTEAMGAGAGALAGAGIGMAVGGPPGAAIGGVAGAVVGAVAGEAAEGHEEAGSGLGAGAGTIAGAAIGGAIAGPPGAVVGGAVGAGAGAGAGDKTEEAAEDELDSTKRVDRFDNTRRP